MSKAAFVNNISNQPSPTLAFITPPTAEYVDGKLIEKPKVKTGILDRFVSLVVGNGSSFNPFL